MRSFCPSSDSFAKVQGENIILFIPPAATSLRNFLVSHKTKNISQTEHASHSGRTRARKWTGLRILCEKRAGKLSKARKSVAAIVRATTHFSSKTRTGTSWRFAAGKVRSLRNERTSAKSWTMSNPAHVPAILQEPRRHRYLKLIALFKIGKGVLLLLLGVSLLFLNARTRWMDFLSNWAADEILLEHSRPVAFLLHKLQAVLAGGTLRATGFLALFYTAVLFTEGIGVYMEQRWAELLMIFATAAFIPLEVRHIWHHPSLAALLILAVNCFIVWFLYFVLRRKPNSAPARVDRELA